MHHWLHSHYPASAGIVTRGTFARYGKLHLVYVREEVLPTRRLDAGVQTNAAPPVSNTRMAGRSPSGRAVGAPSPRYETALR